MKMHVLPVVAMVLCAVGGFVRADVTEDKLELAKVLELLKKELDVSANGDDDLAGVDARGQDDDFDLPEDFEDMGARGEDHDFGIPDALEDMGARGEGDDFGIPEEFEDTFVRGQNDDLVTAADMEEMGITDIDELEVLVARGDLKTADLKATEESKAAVSTAILPKLTCRAKPGSFVKKSRCVWCRCFNGRYVGCTNVCLRRPLCKTGKFSMNLDSTSSLVAYPSLTAMGITVVNGASPNGVASYQGEQCSKTALLKVNFQKLSRRETLLNQCGCTKAPFCGRKVLKIVLTLSKGTRKGHMFNFGDSVSNDGYNGDYGSQSNDGEIHAIYPSATQWSSDYCEPKIKVMDIFTKVLSPPASKVTVWISNEYIRVQNNVGFDQRLCHRCLWALNGQSDKTGPINEDIYLAFNRVVRKRPGRYGVGICRVDISWYCPNCRSIRPFPFMPFKG